MHQKASSLRNSNRDEALCQDTKSYLIIIPNSNLRDSCQTRRNIARSLHAPEHKAHHWQYDNYSPISSDGSSSSSPFELNHHSVACKTSSDKRSFPVLSRHFPGRWFRACRVSYHWLDVHIPRVPLLCGWRVHTRAPAIARQELCGILSRRPPGECPLELPSEPRDNLFDSPRERRRWAP